MFINSADVIHPKKPMLRYGICIEELEIEDWHVPDSSSSVGDSLSSPLPQAHKVCRLRARR
jgi:hypothetical protein